MCLKMWYKKRNINKEKEETEHLFCFCAKQQNNNAIQLQFHNIIYLLHAHTTCTHERTQLTLLIGTRIHNIT